ncbi:MAG: hypothetical protein R6U32_02750 [Candidatus Woesearchaeota archaeon]
MEKQERPNELDREDFKRLGQSLVSFDDNQKIIYLADMIIELEEESIKSGRSKEINIQGQNITLARWIESEMISFLAKSARWNITEDMKRQIMEKIESKLGVEEEGGEEEKEDMRKVEADIINNILSLKQKFSEEIKYLQEAIKEINDVWIVRLNIALKEQKKKRFILETVAEEMENKIKEFNEKIKKESKTEEEFNKSAERLFEEFKKTEELGEQMEGRNAMLLEAFLPEQLDHKSLHTVCTEFLKKNPNTNQPINRYFEIISKLKKHLEKRKEYINSLHELNDDLNGVVEEIKKKTKKHEVDAKYITELKERFNKKKEELTQHTTNMQEVLPLVNETITTLQRINSNISNLKNQIKNQSR